MEPDTKPQLKFDDLKDQTLYKLNQVLSFLYKKIDGLRNSGKFSGTSSFEAIQMPQTRDIPGDSDVVPFGVIKKYFSPQAVRKSLVAGSWLGAPVRPVTGVDTPVAGSLGMSFVDTHSNRLASYPAGNYDVGTFFYESDRTSLYEVQAPGGVNQWVWIAGEYADTLANIPTDLGAYDTRFLFRSTTTDQLFSFRWNGSAFVEIDPFAENATLATYSNTLNSALTYLKAKGTTTTPADAVAGNVIGELVFKALRSSLWTSAARIYVDIEATPSGSTAAGRLCIQTSDTAGSALTTRWSFTADGNLEPETTQVYNVGSATKEALGVYTKGAYISTTLNLATGGTAGDVLVNDGSDNAVWSTAASSVAYMRAEATATNTLTTSYTDTTGCSLSLDRNGQWMVIGDFSFYKDVNDTECWGQLVVDGINEVGYPWIKLDTLLTASVSASRTWVITIASQPKTVKLQAKKVGTGSSTTVIENTCITALFLS